MSALPRSAALLAVALLVTGVAVSQQSDRTLWDRLIQDSYTAHLVRVRNMLPPHSGLPPLLDLSLSNSDQPAKDLAWEDRFKGTMGTRVIMDPGVPGPSQATSVSTTFIDTVGRPFALPAHGCEAIVIATAVASASCFARTHTYVYSRFSLKVSRVLKTDKQTHIREGADAIAVQLGGRIRFPSGHMTTFIVANRGFLELGKQYVLFMWKPPRSRETYMIAEPYLILDGNVFPIKTAADVSAYNGMPLKDFEVKVKAAIAKNIDTD